MRVNRTRAIYPSRVLSHISSILSGNSALQLIGSKGKKTRTQINKKAGTIRESDRNLERRLSLNFAILFLDLRR